jgi:hypothetical protein
VDKDLWDGWLVLKYVKHNLLSYANEMW